MSLHVAAYCRVSTEQGDQINSLNNQMNYFEAYIKNHQDWELIEIFADEGISGTSTRKRRQFNKMIEAAENGEIDLILTKEVSRFARNTVDTLAHTRRLKELGVGVIFINDNIDTRENDGEFRLTIMASVAQEESRKTSERVKWGQKRSMERGVVFGNDTTYGYQTKNGELAVRENEAEVIRLIYHKYLNEGKGTHIIARELYQEGIASPKTANKPWSSTMIYRILTNEKYCGDLLQKKYITLNYLSHKKSINKGHEEKVYIKNHHEAIIDRDVFERTQEEIESRAPLKGEKTKYSNRYWCSGKIKCGNCGSRFVLRKRKRADSSVYKTWCCHARAHYGNWKKNQAGDMVGCSMRTINEKTLMTCAKYVLEQLDFDAGSIVNELIREISTIQDGNQESGRREAINTKISQIQAKKEKVLDAFFNETISKEEMTQMKKRYDAEIISLERKLQGIEQMQSKNLKQKGEIEALSKLLSEKIKTSEEVYSEVIECILVFDNYIDISVQYLPYIFRLSYKTSGKGELYQTEILSCEVINKD